MRPKPSRDWVMEELERLGVRVVSGRLGRKAGEEEEAEKKANSKSGSIFFHVHIFINADDHNFILSFWKQQHGLVIKRRH